MTHLRLIPLYTCHHFQVNYIRDLNQESTAEEGVDYRLYTSDECRLDGITTGGCVSFSPGQTQAALTVEILPDKLVEGTEVFYLRIGIVRNGKKTRDHRYFSMSITIIDGAERKLDTQHT